jgi:ATP synthase subunit 6
MFQSFNPLEQFQLVPLINLRNGAFDFSFTNSSFFIVWSLVVFLLFVYLCTFQGGGTVVPNRWQTILENLYLLVLGVVLDNLNSKGLRYFPFVFTLFIFVLCLNIIGIIPYSFTATSHLIVTFTLSLIVFLGRTYICFREHGFKFFAIFLPPGAPLILLPLLVPIEFISYFITLIALAVRLFANMISGHILLKVLIGFAWTIMTTGSALLFFAHVLPLGVVFLLIGIELAVSFIQAYVFATLTCIYINTSLELH